LEKAEVVNLYARVIRADVNAGKMDAGIEGVKKALDEEIKKLKGFAGTYLLVDRDASKAIYMTFYDNKEAAEAVLQSGVTQNIISKLAEIMVGTPTIEGYEVAIKP
jgi:quinol monooxygenase YgiN